MLILDPEYMGKKKKYAYGTHSTMWQFGPNVFLDSNVKKINKII
jgi:hypothetical protein